MILTRMLGEHTANINKNQTAEPGRTAQSAGCGTTRREKAVLTRDGDAHDQREHRDQEVGDRNCRQPQVLIFGIGMIYASERGRSRISRLTKNERTFDTVLDIEQVLVMLR